ncbi:hypothetical protein T11_4652 [Trichinella zimbabwensis]|uniref:Uncharacterized protein n=1 Tax=Trichinella zimbabwensis TaxID=268475 RepID=A0A0V1HJH4_9BILA|nr:hypothetical protein T11_4652 [Trichinella zimbabwensis]
MHTECALSIQNDAIQIVQCIDNVSASDGPDADWPQMEKMFGVLGRRSDLWENIPGAPQQSGRNTAAHQTIMLETEASEIPVMHKKKYHFWVT